MTTEQKDQAETAGLKLGDAFNELHRACMVTGHRKPMSADTREMVVAALAHTQAAAAELTALLA